MTRGVANYVNLHYRNPKSDRS